MKHILVVDDEPRIAQIARDYLERAGYAVTTADNGADALTTARTRPPRSHRPRPRAAAGRRPRRHARAAQQSNVPIIMLTARVEESDKLVGLELGADDYMTKAVQPARAGRARAGGLPARRRGVGSRRRDSRRRRHARSSRACARRWAAGAST
jgi:DNA-binding response OmpR family regulator